MKPGFPDNPRFFRFSAKMFCQSNPQRWFLGTASKKYEYSKVNPNRSRFSLPLWILSRAATARNSSCKAA
jgi:hypothetical protein